MKLLHTSDWHLGKWLENYSRLNEQREVLDEICVIADTNGVDAVLIAGDVFDTYNPPVEAVELLYTTVKRLSNKGKRPVIVIAGNHDSPERIESPDSLARMNGIIFVGFPLSCLQPFAVEDGFELIKSAAGFIELRLPSGELLRVLLAAFANELRLKKVLDADGENRALHQIWNDLADKYCDTQGVNILIGHLLMFVDDVPIATELDDERSIEHISARIMKQSIPASIQYAALGHLHRFQYIADSPATKIVYCGSPLAYSFSEASQAKYVVLVDVECGASANLTPVSLQAGKKLIRKRCASVDVALQWLTENPTVLVELTIETDHFLDAQVIQSIRNAHDGVVAIIPHVVSAYSSVDSANTESLENKTIQDQFIQYFHHTQGIQPSASILALFGEVINNEALH